MVMVSNISGFKTILVAFDEHSTLSPHYLYIKQHAKKDDSLVPSERSLFIVNVPPYCGKDGLRNLFSDCGSILSVHLMSQPGPISGEAESLIFKKATGTGFQVAYVVFKQASSLQRALSIDSGDVRFVSTEKSPVKTGLRKWLTEFQSLYPDPEAMQAEADEYMNEFDRKLEKEADAAKAAGEPDEEGWVTVASKRRPVVQASAKKPNKRAEKRQRKEKELMNFYIFQQREAKRDKIADLRRHFEADKRKIERMRQERRFKPF